MTRILSWNIQNGISPTGDLSLQRNADVIRDMGAADVICLQEVSRGLPLPGASGAPDQVAELATLFPEYEVLFGVAFEARPPGAGARWQYGNAVLTRLPPLLVVSHSLPRPGAGGLRHMLRQAGEIVVADGSGPLRIVNLHLEFHSNSHRLAQVERLRDLQREALEEAAMPPLSNPAGPYQRVPRPVDSIFCGDFNMLPGSAEYRRLLAPLAGELRPFVDAWAALHGSRGHDPSCGIFDREQWPEGPHCRDFFFAAGNCADALREMRIDTQTDASDHQPLLLELGERTARD